MRAHRRWILDAHRGIAVTVPAGIMGILNATPDSFSDGGKHPNTAAIVRAGVDMIRDGADWLDVGGESTRPGALPVDADSELARVIPIVRGLREAGVRAPISIDTSKGIVAEAALAAGADVVNDVTAGSDPRLLEACAAAACPIVLMHMQGNPQTMQRNPSYADVHAEVAAFLTARIALAIRAGISESAILLDPGIGFGKDMTHNVSLLSALPSLSAQTGRPLVVGISRKSLVTQLIGSPLPAEQRDPPSHVLHALLAPACSLLRVHDPAGARTALRLSSAVRMNEQAA
ncbi:MAG: dihydropteroate synthase [Planctomycetota bacterium]